MRPAGSVVLVGMGADEISLPVGIIQGRELTITGTFRYANTYPTAIALAASGKIDLDGMVTTRYTLDEAETALSKQQRPHRDEGHRPTRQSHRALGPDLWYCPHLTRDSLRRSLHVRPAARPLTHNLRAVGRQSGSSKHRFGL